MKISMNIIGALIITEEALNVAVSVEDLEGHMTEMIQGEIMITKEMLMMMMMKKFIEDQLEEKIMNIQEKIEITTIGIDDKIEGKKWKIHVKIGIVGIQEVKEIMKIEDKEEEAGTEQEAIAIEEEIVMATVKSSKTDLKDQMKGK